MKGSEFWISVISSFFGSLGFTIIFNCRGKKILLTAFGGMLFWTFYLVWHQHFANLYQGFFLSAILMSIWCEVWARILKTPATTLLIPTVIPFIPGSDLYYMMSFALQGELENFRIKMVSAFGQAVSLAAGIMLVTAAANHSRTYRNYFVNRRRRMD